MTTPAIRTRSLSRSFGSASMICLLIRAITVNLTHWHGRILTFQDAASWVTVLCGPPLTLAAMARVQRSKLVLD